MTEYVITLSLYWNWNMWFGGVKFCSFSGIKAGGDVQVFNQVFNGKKNFKNLNMHLLGFLNVIEFIG